MQTELIQGLEFTKKNKQNILPSHWPIFFIRGADLQKDSDFPLVKLFCFVVFFWYIRRCTISVSVGEQYTPFHKNIPCFYQKEKNFAVFSIYSQFRSLNMTNIILNFPLFMISVFLLFANPRNFTMISLSIFMKHRVHQNNETSK